MKYAIDRYGIGVEIEVDADEFENQDYIPQRLTRFFCPECNEIVFFRKKGGNQPNKFYHQKRDNKTPECDKRVDGCSNLSVSQRVGLPLFITRISTGNFQLNIGFPSLGIKTLENATKSDCTVKISSYHQYRTIKVNQSNFLSDNTTLIPVNFIPNYGKNYSISIESRTQISDLQRKWSDYADGFGQNGAIFSYSETGGKKIRRGDSISTNKDYYAVVKNIEIIGEAANMLTQDFQQSHPDTPWKMVKGMRNYIVHEYFQIDDIVVWDVVINNIPELREQVIRYLSETNWEEWEKQNTEA